MKQQEELLEDIREEVKYLRYKSRLTIKDVSERSGVSSATISQFESGVKNTTLQSLIAMLEVTGHKIKIVEDGKGE